MIILTNNIKSNYDNLPSENTKTNTNQIGRSFFLGTGTISEGWTDMKQKKSWSFRVETRKVMLSMKGVKELKPPHH